MAFYAPPAFRKAPQGEILVLHGCNGKIWDATSSGMDHHEVPVAPLNTFMRLHTSNRVPVLPEYAFALCEPGLWPFPSTMDINILPEACLAYDTPVESENPPDKPASADPESNTGTGKRHQKCKGKSKTQSKSAGAVSSASKVSPGCKNQTPQSDPTLVSQVAQDLHLSSEGSDSDNPTETQQGAPTIRDSQSVVDPTRPESGTNLPGPSAPKLDTPTAPPGEEETGETVHPIEPSITASKPVMPDSMEELAAQPTATPAAPAADTTSIPVTTGTPVPPRFPQQPAIPSTGQAPPVPSGAMPDPEAKLQAQITDRSMTYLAQSLTVSSAGGNPDAGAFSGIMTSLRKACGLMSEGSDKHAWMLRWWCKRC